MPLFGDLKEGDMFNTKAARYVKLAGDNRAIVVMSGVYDVGSVRELEPRLEVVVLYPCQGH